MYKFLLVTVTRMYLRDRRNVVSLKFLYRRQQIKQLFVSLFFVACNRFSDSRFKRADKFVLKNICMQLRMCIPSTKYNSGVFLSQQLRGHYYAGQLNKI